MKGADVGRLRTEVLGISQRELAERLGIKPENLSAIENGRRVVGSGLKARLVLVRIEHAMKDRETETARWLRALCEEGLR